MTLNEFKAWLDGFSDAMEEAPTPDQWKKIKQKLSGVRDFPAIHQSTPRDWGRGGSMECQRTFDSASSSGAADWMTNTVQIVSKQSAERN